MAARRGRHRPAPRRGAARDRFRRRHRGPLPPDYRSAGGDHEGVERLFRAAARRRPEQRRRDPSGLVNDVNAELVGRASGGDRRGRDRARIRVRSSGRHQVIANRATPSEPASRCSSSTFGIAKDGRRRRRTRQAITLATRRPRRADVVGEGPLRSALQTLFGEAVILAIPWPFSNKGGRSLVDRRGAGLKSRFALIVLTTSVGRECSKRGRRSQQTARRAGVGAGVASARSAPAPCGARMGGGLGPEGSNYAVIFALQVLPTIISSPRCSRFSTIRRDAVRRAG